MKKDTVIFDLDGTLLNTLEDLAASTNAALRMHGFPERTTDEVRQFVGNGVARLIAQAVPAGTKETETERCLADFKAHYAAHMEEHTAPYPGISELLSSLKEKGYRTAIVSNKFDAAVKNLSSQYFGELVDEAIGESETVQKKPAPDSVFRAMELLGKKPEHCVYVGDSDVDVKTAKNSGIPCIGVTWGFRSRQVLLDAGCIWFADTAEELLQILETENF